jgi:hypothetical protein
MNAKTKTSPTIPLIDARHLSLNDSSEMDIQFEVVAGTKVLIIDNFYRNPEYIRSLALSLDYHRVAGMYPGYLAFVSISTKPLLEFVNKLMVEVIGKDLTFTPYYQDDLAFAVMTKRGCELVPAQRKPHFDDFCDYAGLVYLNPAEQCAGGTSFWRHRISGWESASEVNGATLPALLARFGVTDQKSLVKRVLAEGGLEAGPIQYPTESTPTWERTQVITMKYNRFVFYDSLLFHTPHFYEDCFGETLETRRLTQNLYFNLPKDSAEN